MNFNKDKIDKIFLNLFLNKNINKSNEIDLLKTVFHKNEKSEEYFFSTDSEENFEKNLKIMPNDWHYRTKKIIYSLNSFGYRTDEFSNIDWKESIILFGCSFMFCVGLADDETIAYKLEKITGRKVINLSCPGHSNDFILHNLNYLINGDKIPYATIFGWTSIYRYIFFESEKKYLTMGPWSLKNEKNIPINIKKIYELLNKFQYNFEKNNFNIFNSTKAITKNRCKQVDFSFFSDTAEIFKINNFVNDLGARDLKHASSKKTDEIVDFIVNSLNDK